MRKYLPSFLVTALLCARACAQVVINEIHYHPVERPAFNAGGDPIFQGTATVADFSDDIHEFIELYNVGAAAVSLNGWRIEGGADFIWV